MNSKQTLNQPLNQSKVNPYIQTYQPTDTLIYINQSINQTINVY